MQILIGRWRDDGNFDTFAALNNNNLELDYNPAQPNDRRYGALEDLASRVLLGITLATDQVDLVAIEQEDLTDTLTIDRTNVRQLEI